MGLCYPSLGFAFMPAAKRSVGSVGFLSQSGGIAIAVYTAGSESGVGFSKVFSFGNQIDVTAPEIMDYFVQDDETSVVGAYIEGTRDGRLLFEAMRRLASEKPVVVLKGGRTEEGSRAASSHTGALAGSTAIWNAAFRQANIPTVSTVEDLVATLSVFSQSPPPPTRAVGIVAISGGASVVYSDLCSEIGLQVPATTPQTRERLDPLIADVGTGLGNPIDLAADYYQDQTISEVIRIVGEDSNFGSLIIEADVANIYRVASIMDAVDAIDGYWESLASAANDVVKGLEKPVLIAIPEIGYPEARMQAWRIFVEAGLPVFRSFREAAGALARVYQYYEGRRQGHGSS